MIKFMLRTVIISCILDTIFISAQETTRRQALRRRCYTCRSRGEKGDCRDPFIPPASERSDSDQRIVNVNTAVEETECSTGWCSKTLEGLDNNFGDNGYGIATERECMERAPSDNQERCALVKRGHHEVYMCFCKGDLCNTGQMAPVPMVTTFIVIMIIHVFCRGWMVKLTYSGYSTWCQFSGKLFVYMVHIRTKTVTKTIKNVCCIPEVQNNILIKHSWILNTMAFNL